MLRVETKQARPGMVLAMAVPNPQDPKRQLLNAGFKLDEKIIVRMRDIGVYDIMVDYPDLVGLEEIIVPEIDHSRRALVGQVAKFFDVAQHNTIASIPFDQYQATMSEMIQALMDNRMAMLFMTKANDDQPLLLEQSSTVTFISLMMGLKLDWYLIKQRTRLSSEHAKEVFNLGMGAMLHDVGMLSLDEETRKRFEQTGDESDPVYQTHTRLGYDMVREKVSATASIVVLNHHQYYNGTGYPDSEDYDGNLVPLAGEKIHVYARIVAIASTFARFARPTPETTVPTVSAINRMLQPQCVGRFDPDIFKVFMEIVPPYPPGSPVMLNDGRFAAPLAANPKNPCRPPVQIISPKLLFNPQRASDQEEALPTIHLEDHPELWIAKVDQFDVAEDNFVLSQLVGAPAT